MMRTILALLGATLIAAGACADDDLTGVGGDLLRGGTVRTVELVLEPAEFLRGAETASGFTGAAATAFGVVAEDFEGVLDAHTLVRFTAPPAAVEVEDAQGTTQTDSAYTLVGGELVVTVDSASTLASGPVELELRRLAEPWDPGSADWTLRIDSGSVQRSWREAGGTTDALVSTVDWAPGQDTVVLPVDSQTVAAWADTADAARGALIAAGTSGGRLLLPRNGISLRYRIRPSVRTDTVVTATVATTAATFVFDPPPDAAGALHVGGTPAWRSYFELRERLDTLTVPVPVDGDTVRVPLSEASINFAALVLRAVPAPPPFAPADSINFALTPVLPAEGVPLTRAPLAARPVGVPPAPLPPARFSDAADSEARVDVPITRFLTDLTRSPADTADDVRATALALIPRGRRTFGIGTFAGPDGEGAPRLRILVTVATDIEIE